MYPRLLSVLVMVSVTAGSAGTQKCNAAPEGSVKAVKDGLILISIGSEDGLNVGDTLDVYRTTPQSVYCGRLRLLNVEPTQAVGQLTTKTDEQVRVKDRVAMSRAAESPTPERGAAENDLLRDAGTRMQIEQQRLAQTVKDELRKARQRYPEDPAAAHKVIRETLLRVLDNPKISESVRNDLLDKVLEARKKLGAQRSNTDRN